jgi:hypothetical protein
MALVTPRALKDAAVDWINRDDFTEAQLNIFCENAFDRLLKDHRAQTMMAQDYWSVTKVDTDQYNPAYASPSGFVTEITEVYLNGKLIPQVPSMEMVKREREDSTTRDGVCMIRGDFFGREVFYSGYGEDPFGVEIGAPDDEWTFWGKTIENLDWTNDNTTAKWLRELGDVFLYVLLSEISVYLRDLEGAQVYNDRAEMGLNQAHDSRKRREVMGKMSVQSVGGDYYFDRSY